MTTSRPLLLLAAVLLCAVTTTPAARAQSAGQPHAPDDVTRTMTLTDAQVRGFFDAVDELGDLAGTGGGGKPGRPEAFARGLRVSEASLPTLRKHGFQDTVEFQRVAYNAALAYGVLKDGGKEAVAKKTAKAEAQQAEALEKMRQHLTPEQAAALGVQAKAGMAQAGQMRDVPEENVELMKKYRDRMEKLGERSGGATR